MTARFSAALLLAGAIAVVGCDQRDPTSVPPAHYFFAESLPGAPVHLRVVSGDQTVMELVQLERFRPPDPVRVDG